MKKVAILCVDDEMIILESLKQQLVKNFNNTYLYEYAQDGEEALEVIDYFLAEGVDLLLVISDYQMPGMQGDQFATVLKQRLPGINIVMLTGKCRQTFVMNSWIKMLYSRLFQSLGMKETLSRSLNS
jgi:CheY-like chemotaxis protein